MKASYRVIVAAGIGIACHVAFIVAIAMMAYEIYFGFTRGICPLGDQSNRLWNLVLLVQFPVLHSFFLSKTGRKLLAALSPFGSDMSTTTFALVSSLQLIAVFGFWTPTEKIWFAPHGLLLAMWSLIFAAAWIFLGKAIVDANLALHSGYLGWSAVIRGKKPRFAPPAERGSLRTIRQPIYLAFALILLVGPVWSFDHFLFASAWGAYCFIGPVFKERRLRAWYGDWYREYERRVPYMVPRVWGRRGGNR